LVEYFLQKAPLSIWFIFSSTRTDNFQAATLDEAEEELKHAYNLIELSEAKFLEKTINIGLC